MWFVFYHRTVLKAKVSPVENSSTTPHQSCSPRGRTLVAFALLGRIRLRKVASASTGQKQSVARAVTSTACRGLTGCVRVTVHFVKNGKGSLHMGKSSKGAKQPKGEVLRFGDESVRMLVPGTRIQKRMQEMGQEIRKDFPDEPLILVGVLKGAVFFLADLARQIGGEVTFDFIAVSSYGKDTKSSGQVRLNKDLDTGIEGKTVIVVEDILDTGLTLQYLLRILDQRKPRHLRVAVLLDKTERRIAPVRADYVGFTIPNEFVVGYGLDYAERYRNLPGVGILSLPAPRK